MKFPTVLEIGQFKNRLGHAVQIIERRHWAPELVPDRHGIRVREGLRYGEYTACGVGTTGMVHDFASIEGVNCLKCQSELAAHVLRTDGESSEPWGDGIMRRVVRSMK